MIHFGFLTLERKKKTNNLHAGSLNVEGVMRGKPLGFTMLPSRDLNLSKAANPSALETTLLSENTKKYTE